MLLARNHPARSVPANVATYWSKPGHAITEIHMGLLATGVTLADPVVSFNDKRENHRSFELRMTTGEPIENSMLVFSWYWVSDVRVEITTYLS